MEQPDVAQLQQEITRLNKIIDLLLQQNEELRATSIQTEEETAINNKLYSLLEQLQTTKQTLYSTTETPDGIISPTHSLWQLQMGINQALYSLLELRRGTSKATHSSALTHMATKLATYSVSETREGTKQVTQPLPQQQSATSNATHLLPPKLDVASGVVGRLSSLLRAQKLATGPESSSETAAQVMVHIYNKEESSYAQLRRLTGQSEGGLAKLLMRLRKKGLITRIAFQQFALSPTALDLLQQVWERITEGHK